MGIAIQDWHAFAAQAEDLAGLCFVRNAQAGGTVQSRDVNVATQGSGGHGDGDLTMQVITVALEDVVLLDADLDVEIARRAATHARLALAGEPDARAVLDARRNVDGERALLGDAALARTGVAGVRDHLAAALAGGAGPLHREEAGLRTHGALATAGRTGLR